MLNQAVAFVRSDNGIVAVMTAALGWLGDQAAFASRADRLAQIVIGAILEDGDRG